jgi:hypothetical protein
MPRRNDIVATGRLSRAIEVAGPARAAGILIGHLKCRFQMAKRGDKS